MSWFSFSGENGSANSSDLGLIVTSPLLRPSWAQIITETTAPGNTRKFVQRISTYDNEEIVAKAVIDNTIPENIRRIYSVLSGYGLLTLSSSPNEYLYATVKTLVPQAVAQYTAELPISFVCEPFAYSIATTETELTSLQTVASIAGAFCAPVIKFTPSGAGNVTVNINGKDFVVSVPNSLVNKQIIVDCDAQVTYYVSSGEKVSINQLTMYDYPLLHTGDNVVSISGSVTASSMIIRERWL